VSLFVFGKEQEKGIRLHGMNPEVVSLKEVSRDDLLIHDERAPEPSLAFLLSRMRYPDFPEPVGIFRDIAHDRYVDLVRKQIDQAKATKGEGDLTKLVEGHETWTVG
jgi:2-oxoglutarate ferredoxin oxidoreductase subunit beta